PHDWITVTFINISFCLNLSKQPWCLLRFERGIITVDQAILRYDTELCAGLDDMSDQHALIRLAENAEDAASGLYLFRDSLPQNATQITVIISELFANSSLLREISHAYSDLRYQPSFWRIREDMGLLVSSSQATYQDVLLMFRRAPGRGHHQIVWEDMRYRMEHEESLDLSRRVQLYTIFLKAQRDIIKGRRAADIRHVKRRLEALLEAQETGSGLQTPRVTRDAEQSRSIPLPRSRQAGLPSQSISPLMSSSDVPEGWTLPYPPGTPPIAPEVPLPSPGFSSGSSLTLASSQTSYGSDAFAQTSPRLIHWAQNVFRGSSPATPFSEDYHLNTRSLCDGPPEPGALHEMCQNGFQLAINLPFDSERLCVEMFWRPVDNRARIFIRTKDGEGHDRYYCTSMHSLKVIRQRSCLQLCTLSRIEDLYRQWARLNFYHYERMVLFYCTFIAMKYQDERELPNRQLNDFCELSQPPGGEELLYGGVVRDGELAHTLRLFLDHGSGAVRLEASAYRGRMRDVPLWTAFVTRWANDPDWAGLEPGSRKIVSLAVIRPPPYVFLLGYMPPQNTQGQYIMHFVHQEANVDAPNSTQGLHPALEWSHEEVMDMLEVNVAGARLSAVSCARQMVKYNCPGSIVIVASMSAFIANDGLECHIYNGSKAGVVGMSRVLAMEWAKIISGLPIRVNFLCPGNIMTPMVLKNFADDPTLRVKWEKANMLGRISIPEEYKGAIIYMLSQASSFMTGAALVIHGGYTAK
ncbi:hypothetical protein Tdes44962_MAKER05909, partial [Teratosphaeria destructans]